MSFNLIYAHGSYAPAYERFGSQISAIHFIGPNKPWNSLSFRSPFSSQPIQSATTARQAYDYDSLVNQWFNVYDRHYRSQLVQQPRFEARHYQSAWNQTAVPPPSQDVLNLDQLRRLAIEGISAASTTPYDRPLDEQRPRGQYQSMPLEGRVDLMPPKAEASVEVSLTVDMVDAFEEEKRSESLSTTSFEEDPRTPVPRTIDLPGQTPLRWYTLPTPGPDDLPPSPHIRSIPLPPVTPGVGRDTPTLLSFSTPSAPESPSNRLSKLKSRQLEHHRILSPLPAIFTKPDQHKPPARPHSPTMLIWNPAIEPPPTGTPAVTAFPTDTYFPNAWDASPVKLDKQTHQEPRTPLPDSKALFEPLPRTDIPETLIRQGHYRNVTGENHEGATPSPDSTKVKPVFPWEERPRHLPSRVFPVVDSPKPALFLSPESQSSRTSSELPTTPEMKPGTPPRMLSPLHGAPPSFTYPNAWDTDPSIKKYASRLVRPPATQTLAPAFEEGWEKAKNSWDDKVEASSRDGDVEDEGEDSEEEKAVEKEDEKPTEDILEPKSMNQIRSRRGSSALTVRSVVETLQYRDIGVQTEARELKSEGVQTISPPPLKNIEAPKKPTLSGKRHWTPASRPNIPPSVTMHDAESAQGDSPTSTSYPTAETRLRSPTLRSPSTRLPIPPIASPPVHSKSAFISQNRVASSPASSTSVISRQASNDSSVASPISSVGPLSPSEGQTISSPRKSGRVWDPARGVELFKRGSEEVLARFLKMGTWEDER